MRGGRERERIDLVLDLAPEGFSGGDIDALLTHERRGELADRKGRVAEERVWRLLERITLGEEVSFRWAKKKEEGRQIDLVITRIGLERTYVPIQVKASSRAARRFIEQMKEEGRRIPVVVAGSDITNISIEFNLRRIISGEAKSDL